MQQAGGLRNSHVVFVSNRRVIAVVRLQVVSRQLQSRALRTQCASQKQQKYETVVKNRKEGFHLTRSTAHDLPLASYLLSL